MNYLPIYPRATEIRKQRVFKFAPTTATVDCSQWQNAHLSNCCHQQLAVGADGRVFQPLWVVQSPYHPVWNSPSNMVSINGMHMMTVDQTSTWIRSLCLHWGWRQTEGYVTSFRGNKINGSMLTYLNHEILRFDLGIENHFHRLNLLAVIRQFFPCFNLNSGSNQPTRLSDLRNMYIKYVNVSKITTRMEGSLSTHEKPSFLKRPVSDKDDSLGIDSNSLQNISLKSVSTKSDSSMECSEGKPRRSRTGKPFPQTAKLESKGITAISSSRHMYSVEKAFGGSHELRIGKSRNANDLFTVQKEETFAREVAAKLILTASSFNFVVMEAIRDRFLKFNFVVTIEQASHYSCVVTFQSRMEAMRAFDYQHEIGYKLDHYEENRCQTRMSPVVSQSYSLDASSTDVSESVVRASKVLGWVSLESEEGRKLLKT